MDRDHAEISVRRQCELLGLSRSGLYYEPLGESEENLALMRLLDEQYTRAPYYGSRRMVAWLGTQGFEANRKRVSRLMTVMGNLRPSIPNEKLSLPGEGHRDLPVPAERGWGGSGSIRFGAPDIVRTTDVAGLRVPGGCDGLVQPVCPELEIVGEPGTRLLRRGAEVRPAAGPTGDFQYGPGFAVHQ